MQLAGFWMALATFVGIWWGHVGVRWIERNSASVVAPMVVLAVAGLGLNSYALLAADLTISGVCSIIGITLLWDAFEVYRQQKRIVHGHAPANPANPRHAAILATSPRATTVDLLNREPQGAPTERHQSPGAVRGQVTSMD